MAVEVFLKIWQATTKTASMGSNGILRSQEIPLEKPVWLKSFGNLHHGSHGTVLLSWGWVLRILEV